MKRIPHITLLSILTLLLVITACKDKNKNTNSTFCEDNPGQCQTVLAAKDFFLFKQGSWWVYEEETSHERDSMYVTEYSNSNGYDFDCRIKSALTGYEYHYWPFYAGGNTSCSQTAPNSGKCLLVKISKGKIGDFIGEGDCFFFSYKLNAYETSFNTEFPNNRITVVNILSDFAIGANNFGETVKIHELNTYIEGVQPTNRFYSKNIGLSKLELLDSNQVWNLVSYHIEP